MAKNTSVGSAIGELISDYYESDAGQRSLHIKSLKKTANAEQKKIIDYFAPSLLSSTKEPVFDQIASKMRESIVKSREMALKKLGLDEDEINGVHPKIRGRSSGNCCCSHAAATPSDVLH